MIIKKVNKKITFPEHIENFKKDDKIVVGITSFPARINYINSTLESLFSQTLKPDMIYLVLCKKEFLNLENDLPESILTYLRNNINFKILWVDENIKQFKKNLPIIKKYKGRDDVVIFTADDDIIYNADYIRILYNRFKFYNMNEKTVVTWNFPWTSVNKSLYKYEKKPIVIVGYCEVIKPSFFNDIVLEITESDLNTKNWISEDLWITYNLIQNNIQFKEYPYEDLSSLLYTDKQIATINALYDIHVKTIDPIKRANIKNLYNKYLSRKPYDAIIAMTSYEARLDSTYDSILSIKKINTKYKYKFVLTLEKKLKNNIKFKPIFKKLSTLSNFEIIYVNTDYNVYKKVLFAMDKYKNLPIISADDGVSYIKNFADILMDNYQKTPNKIIGYTHWKINDVEFSSGGFGVLFFPNCFLNYGITLLKNYFSAFANYYNDDMFYGILANILNIEYKFLLNMNEYPANKFFIPIEKHKFNGLKQKTINNEQLIKIIRYYVNLIKNQ